MTSVRVGKQLADFLVVAIHSHQNSFAFQAYSQHPVNGQSAADIAVPVYPGARLSSAPAACSVSATAVLGNGETKKDLDYRSAFRHTNYRAATRPHPEVCTLPLNPVTIELAFRNQEGNLVGSVS
jgi:hypothetical protein